MTLRHLVPILALLLALAPASAWGQNSNPETAELNRLLAQAQARKAAERAAQGGPEEGAAAEAMADGEEWFEEWVEAEAEAEAAEAEPEEAAEPAYAFGPEAIQHFRSLGPPYGIEHQPRLEAFDLALRMALSDGATLDTATTALGSQVALDPPALADFIRLWIETRTFARIYDEADQQERARWAGEFLAFMRAHGDLPLVLEAGALALSDDDDCASDIPARLLEGRSDPIAAAWLVASVNDCRESVTAFATAFPDRALGALIQMEDYGWVKLAGLLPLSAWLVRDEALARIAPEDRAVVSAALHRRHLINLLDAGFAERAVAFADGLPKAMLERLFDPATIETFVTLDNLPYFLSTEYESDDLHADLAAANYLVGRADTARAMIEYGGKLERQRAILACLQSDTDDDREDCWFEYDEDGTALMLAHLLDMPEADPYPLAEAIFGHRNLGHITGVAAALHCRVFAADRFGDICAAVRRWVGSDLTAQTEEYNRKDHDPVMAAVRQLGLPGFAALEADYAALVEAQLDRVGLPAQGDYTRASIDPVHPGYTERPLPAGLAAYAATPYDEDAGEDGGLAWPEGWAAPPPGFAPVRWEQQGARAAFVSLSSFYNPSGEISEGGYWVHLSDDGGRSWRTPRFTGLAQFWPYIVTPQSALPMLGTDGLTLEVAVRELDTASISYPPVGLATRREVDGLVLEIPFARLTSDSDNDGLSDLAEAHLLLDRRGADRPFVVGSGDSAACPATPDRQTLATAAILSGTFELESRAIIEPVNRPGAAIDFGKWSGKDDPIAAPLFLQGNPADFACIDAAQPVIVYTEAQVAQLQRHSPDFRTIEMPRGVWNADQTRGYVQWSAGWVGGTLLLVWTGSGWDISSISDWIT